MKYDYKKIKLDAITSNAATISVFVDEIDADYNETGFSATFREKGSGVFYTASLDKNATDLLFALNARITALSSANPPPVMVTLLPSAGGNYTILGLY